MYIVGGGGEPMTADNVCCYAWVCTLSIARVSCTGFVHAFPLSATDGMMMPLRPVDAPCPLVRSTHSMSWLYAPCPALSQLPRGACPAFTLPPSPLITTKMGMHQPFLADGTVRWAHLSGLFFLTNKLHVCRTCILSLRC